MKDKTLLLIDGDELVYKAGFASQSVRYNIVCNDEIIASLPNKREAIEWVEDPEMEYDIVQEIIPFTEDRARYALYAVMNTILADNDPTDYRVYLTGDNNFRFEVATLLPYKGKREQSNRPVHYNFIRQVLQGEYAGQVVDGIEADDALSITQWHHEINDTSWSTIIATQDKDLKMVPGHHYNPSKREKYHMSPVDARFSFYCQLLSGDSTDNIPGIYRIGETVAAKKLLRLKNKSNKELYTATLKAYNEAQATDKIREKMPGDKWGEDRIKEVGRLLWMLQEKYQLWNPGENYYGCVGLD